MHSLSLFIIFIFLKVKVLGIYKNIWNILIIYVDHYNFIDFFFFYKIDVLVTELLSI